MEFEARDALEFEDLKKGKVLHGNYDNDATQLPAWMDIERFKRGRQFFKSHIAAMCLALHCSLTVLFGVSKIDRALTFTRNSDTPTKALRRYVKTFVHIVVWHTYDVWDVNSIGHKSTQSVRKMHSTVRSAIEHQNPTPKRYISQYDMALVQAGFMAAVAMYPSRFGIKCTRQELEDYVFFWRGIGYLLGIKDRFNLCSGDYDQFYKLGKAIEHRVIYRGIINPPPEFETLANSYINGMNSLVLGMKLFTKESVIAFTFKIMKLPLVNLKITWIDWLRILLLKFLAFSIRWVPGVERLMNCMTTKIFKVAVEKEYDEFAVESAKVLDNAVSYF